MTDPGPERRREDFHEVVASLRAHKTEATPLELDEIKLRAMRQASHGPSKTQGGIFVRSKLVTMLLVLGLVIGGGGAGVIAGGSGGGGGGKNGAKGEYKPGKGCGDKNHTHTGPPGNPTNTDCPPQSGGKK